VKVRLLFLWGPGGVPPAELYFIGVSDPFLIPQGTADQKLPLPVLWNKVPTGITPHPCALAIVLPEVLDKAPLNDAAVQAFQNVINSNANPYGPATKAQLRVDLNALMAPGSYNLSNLQVAQMNIDPSLPGFACPVGADCKDPVAPPPMPNVAPGGGGIQLRVVIPPLLAQAPGEPGPPMRPGPVATPEPPASKDDVLVDFEGFAFTKPKRGGKTVIVEPLGGVRKALSPAFLKDQTRVPLEFNVTNIGKETRIIVIGFFAQVPDALKTFHVEVPPLGGAFQPGETRKVTAILTSVPPNGGPGSYPQPPGKYPPAPGKNPPVPGKSLPGSYPPPSSSQALLAPARVGKVASVVVRPLTAEPEMSLEPVEIQGRR
jgi:hypothetical protein